MELTRRGIPARDLRPVDGSGLSRYNMATARGLVRVLFTSLREPYGAALVDSLPVAGLDGTLAYSLKEPEFRHLLEMNHNFGEQILRAVRTRA